MSTDYSKKKNAELAEILKSRSLPHTGKKDELIARLQESDAKAASTTTNKEAAKPTTTAVEDEIDWDDETPIVADPPATSEPAAAAIAAGGLGRIANPTAVPNQIPAIDPSKASGLTAEAAPATTKPATEAPKPSNEKPADVNPTEEKPTESNPPPADFTSGVPTTTLDDELLKRQKRAQRFGTTDSTSSDALKALERAKKFGTTTSDSSAALVKGLDEPLPERTKGTKRGRGDKDDGDNARAGSKPRRQGGGGRRDQSGRNGGRRGAGGRKRDGNSGSPAPGKANGLNEKDRVKAEARKSRFAAAA